MRENEEHRKRPCERPETQGAESDSGTTRNFAGYLETIPGFCVSMNKMESNL